MLEFTIYSEPRTKKNSPMIVNNGRYPRLLPSKTFRAFESECMPEIISVRNSIGCIADPVNIKCTFYMKTKRRVDLTNLLEAIDDVMVKGGLLLDDNRDVIIGHDGSRVYYDRDNPRVEVVIKRVVDYEQWKSTRTD